MTTATAETPESSPAPRGLAARFFGIIVSPRVTFESVARNPHWVGMLILVALVSAGATAAFLSTEIGRQAALDQQVSTLESFGIELSDEQYARLERRAESAALTSGLSLLVATPAIALVVAGILFAVFNAFLGGEATFRQLFAVVVHVGPIGVVHLAFMLPMGYLGESMSSPTNLSVFFPVLEEGTFLIRFLGSLDLFYMWRLLVLAIGLAVLYKRRTQPIAITLLAIYVLFAVAFGFIGALRGAA